MKKSTVSDIKKKNQKKTLEYIYIEKTTYQQLICEELNISRPTVISILKELEEGGIIEKNGYFESTGGRKANALTFVPDFKIAIGVELLSDSYEIVALNLYGETMFSGYYKENFRNSDDYFKIVCDKILLFIKENLIEPEKIIGVGIVLQGLISSDSTCVTYGKILDCTGLEISAFTKYLPFDCKFFHDAEAGAEDELWNRPDLNNAIYMNIRNNVSGAIIVNRTFLKGTELKSGIFEHMSLIPNGKQCYCGNRGCIDVYCSTQALIDLAGSLDDFFDGLRNDVTTYETCWIGYLHYLSSAINNLRMFIDYPIIIGGTIAPYLKKEDINLLHRLIRQKTAFPTESEFIYTSVCSKSPISRGAAISYIKEYLNSIGISIH